MTKKRIVNLVLLVLFVFAVILFFPGRWPWILLGVVAIGIGGLLVVYFVLAPKNLFWTFVQEGYVKIVVKGGEVIKILIQWKDYTLDSNYNVVPVGVWTKDGDVLIEKNGNLYKITKKVKQEEKKVGKKKIIEYTLEDKEDLVPKNEASPPPKEEKKHPFGGLRWYGFWPVRDVYIFSFRWTGLDDQGKPRPHEETLDAGMLKDYTYFTEITKAEDKKKVPLTIKLVLTMRIVNPYKALFKVHNWLDVVLNRTQPFFREYVARHTYDELIAKKQRAGGDLWKELLLDDVIQEFKRDYGIEVKDGGIEMRDIDLPDEYQKAATKKYLAEKDKERITVEANAEAARMKAVYGQVQDFGELGRLVRMLEAVERSPLAASLTVQAVPGLQELLRGISAKPTGVTSKEEIIEIIKKTIEETRK